MRVVARAGAGVRGTATVEFVLVFPVVLFLGLILAQVMLLMASRVYILHAAHTAARTAIVQVPAEVPGEPANTLGSEKREAIRLAAAFALLPVSGGLSPDSADAPLTGADLAAGLSRHFADYGRSAPNWVERVMPYRLAYATRHTDVRLETLASDTFDQPFTDPEQEPWREVLVGDAVPPHHPLRLTVSHRFHLAIPYVSWVFADGSHDTLASSGSSPQRTPYVVLTDRLTLTNEGQPIDLPGPARSPGGDVVPRYP